MSAACDQAKAEVGNGVAAALRAVDCTANEVTASAFGRLFAPGGALGPTLSILLAIFIALFAIALMLGRTNLSVRSLVPRMVTLGLVLTFATSWAAYQGIVWNLAIFAPDYLASVLTGTDGSATAVFAQKLDIVFVAIEQATQGGAPGVASANGQGAEIGSEITAFSPKGILWMGAMILLLGTVGVLVTARIALAVLVALGPIFVVLALFPATRGLFVGWLKGVVMLALTPLLAVIGGGVMLELSVPILSSLSQVPGEVGTRPAVAFFLIGAVHAALMVITLKVAGTMVAGWRVFGLVPDAANKGSDMAASTRAPAAGATTQVQSTAQAAGMSNPPRRIAVSGVTPAAAANDASSGGSSVTRRETKVFATSSGSGRVQATSNGVSRAHGIGSRFRPANSRQTEKVK
ncbi:type IV secretion system protein [Erythrobacter sp. HKB08]|uniref:type IV secretion system protein n=1 Tax=Erythrobacter sp. HKB08 TaxID=2502843 RepID=UPI0010093BAC|nr:type IV secretion system protein [Erythrobacter sp. HKB08]